MSDIAKDAEFAQNILQRAARVELEERMLGWQLKESPGTTEAAMEELRVDALMFQVPLNQIHPFEEAHVIPFEEDQEDHPTESDPLHFDDPLRPRLTNGKGAAA